MSMCACGHSDCASGGGGYYVSIRRDSRTGLLLGPYETHGEALDNLSRGRQLAHAADPWSEFDAFGTLRLKAPHPKAVFA